MGRATCVGTQGIRKEFTDSVGPPVLVRKRADQLEAGDDEPACFLAGELGVLREGEQRGRTESGVLLREVLGGDDSGLHGSRV